MLEKTKNFLLCAIFVISGFNLSFSSTQKSIKDLFKLSIEEMMNVEISVVSIMGEKILISPSSVTVIDQQTIKQYNFTSIAEAMEIVPGIEIYQTIIDRNVPTSRGILQNFYANKILILINGIATWQPIYGEGYIDRISIHDVEKIEILKGPASVLYGSNAYSGVVNIILKDQKTQNYSGYGQTNIHNTHSTGFSTTIPIANLNITTSFNSYDEKSDPYDVPSARGFDFHNDSTFQYSNITSVKNFNFKTTLKNHSLFYNWFDYSHSFLGAHPSYLGGGNNLVNNQGYLFSYAYDKNLNENLDIKTNINYDHFMRDFPLSYDRMNLISLQGDRTDIGLLLNYFKNNINIEFGANHEIRHSHGHSTYDAVEDTLIRENLQNVENITGNSIFTRVGVSLKNYNFSGGSRLTHNKNFKNNLSSHLSAVYSISKHQSIKAIWAESFRAPTMFEMYFDHPTVIGNKSLKPETSKSYELAYLLGKNKIFFQILSYYGQYTHLIQRVTPPSGPPSQYKNVNHFHGYGTEIEIKFQNSPDFNFFINYNFLKGENENIDNNYKYIPDHTISWGFYKNFKNFYISTKSKFISSMEGHLEQIDPQFNIDFNIGVNQSINGVELRHVLGFKNLTNSKMLTPEYIRQTPNINSIETQDFGTRVIYSVFIKI